MSNAMSARQVNSRNGDYAYWAIRGWLWGVICLMTWLPANLAVADSDSKNISSTNIIAQHDRNSSQFNKNCVSCHANVLSSKSLNTAIPRAHVAMLPFAPGESNNDKCVFCHHSTELVLGLPQPIDLAKDSSGIPVGSAPSKGSVRRPVDSAVCALCHGPGGQTRTPKTKQFYKVDIGSIPAYDLTKPNAGKALYETICSGCHKTLGKSEVKGESASEIKKKIAENEGGMGPLKVLTDAQIQAIANALAQ